MANMIKFFKGSVASLPATGVDGALYITNDEGGIYLGTGTGMKRLGDFVQVDNVASLPAKAHENCLYYCVTENILAKWNGAEWKQVNKQPTTEELKTLLGLGSLAYLSEVTEDNLSAELAEKVNAASEGNHAHANKDVLDGITAEKVAAWDAAEQNAKDYADTELAKKVDKVTGKSLVDDAEITKLAGVSAGANKVEASENGKIKIDGVDTVVYTHPDKHAIADVDGLQDALDGKQAAGDYATKAEAQGYADAKDDAIAEAKAAGTAASEALNEYKEANDAAVAAKVASVTAGDNSVTIGGTATAPTVAAKLSADADNALELAEDGLKVVIPAAAEYSIVKAADSGDYAAVYNLTKDGTVVGASINIPKDMVVKSGSVVGDEIVLVLNDEAATEIKIPVASLIEYVTSGSQAGDMVVIAVDETTHKVTATITDGTITAAKLTTELQTAIGKAHSHENADVLAGINADKVAAWDAAEQNAKDYADTELAKDRARLDTLEAIDHDAYVGADAALKAELQAEIDADVKALADGAVATNAASIAANAEAIAANAAAITSGDEATLTSAKTYTDGLLEWGSF